MSEFQITLPSRGVFDGDKMPGGKVSLHSLTTREQGIMYSQGVDPLKRFDLILSNCVTKAGLPVSEWLMTDRLYAMVNLRMRSFGGDYEVPMRCASCREQYRQQINLAKEITLRTYVDSAEVSEEEFDQVVPLGSNPAQNLQFTCPQSKDVLTFRFLRGRHEEQIARQSKRVSMQSVDVGDPSLPLRLGLMIEKINDQEMAPHLKHAYIQSMDAGDMEAFSTHVEDTESGLDLTVATRCSSCGYEEEVSLPLTAEFFRPRRGKRKRAGIISEGP